MVVFNNSNPNTNRRAGLASLVTKGSWRLSWRSSKKNVSSCNSPGDHRDEFQCRELKEVKERKHVNFADDKHLVEEIFFESGVDQIQSLWYQVSVAFASIPASSFVPSLHVNLFQADDYGRFQKDRVLTSFGYLSSRRIGADYDDDEHSVRGLELLCDSRLGKKLTIEKKELARLIREEEARQKREGTFPNLNRFSTVSARYSRSSRNRAISLAQDDARACKPKSRNHMAGALSRFRQRSHRNGGVNVMPRRRSLS